jgi:hypothetical protein
VRFEILDEIVKAYLQSTQELYPDAFSRLHYPVLNQNNQSKCFAALEKSWDSDFGSKNSKLKQED